MADDEDFISLDGIGDDSSEESGGADASAESGEKDKKESGAEDKEKDAKGDGITKPEGKGLSSFDHYQASKNQFDQFLAVEDEGFAKSLKDLEDIKSEDVGELESIELDESMLKMESINFFSRFLKKIEFFLRPFYWFRHKMSFVFFRLGKFKARVREKIRFYLNEGKAQLIENIKSSIALVIQKIKDSITVLKNLRWRGRILLIVLIGFTFGLTKYFNRIVSGDFLPHSTAQSVISFEQVADKKFIIDFKRGVEPFDSPLRHSEHIVLLKNFVANLRPNPKKDLFPMGLFEIFVEGSNQEVAVEIRDREVELVDRFIRNVESMSYDELNSSRGKNRLKIAVRKDFNTILNKGRAKRILFKVITLKH